MTETSLPEVQAAVYALLTGAAAYMQLLTGVFDAVPDAQPYPYAVIGDATEVPDRTMGQGGHEVTFAVTIHTEDGSRTGKGKGRAGYALGLGIARAQTDLLLGGTLAVAGHDVVDLDLDSLETYRADDGVGRRIEARYRLWLEDSL